MYCKFNHLTSTPTPRPVFWKLIKVPTGSWFCCENQSIWSFLPVYLSFSVFWRIFHGSALSTVGSACWTEVDWTGSWRKGAILYPSRYKWHIQQRAVTYTVSICFSVCLLIYLLDVTVIFTVTDVQNFSKYVLINLLSRTNEKSVS